MAFDKVFPLTPTFDLSSIRDELTAENVRVGVAGMPPLLVLVHATVARLDPIPRRVDLHTLVGVSGRLDRRFHAPHVGVTIEGGPLRPLPVAVDEDGTFASGLECEPPAGIRWVSLEALDEHNETTRIGLFPLACGVPLVTKYYVEPRQNLSPRDREARILALLNRERLAAHLDPLRPESRLQSAARKYALKMSRAQSVAHDLGGTSPSQRLRESGIVPPVLSESTLEGADLGAVAEVLWNDPAYRATVESRTATHVGVGIAEDRHELFVAIDSARIVPVADLEAVKLRLTTQALAQVGSAVKADATLEHFADRAARELAAGRSSRDSTRHLGRELLQAMPRGAVLDVAQVILRDTNEWNDELLVSSIPFDSIGIGVAQTPREGLDAGQLWVVIFFAAHVDAPFR